MRRIILVFLVLLLVRAEKDYTDFVKTLQKAQQTKEFKSAAYNRLANFSDTFGPRMWGSAIL